MIEACMDSNVFSYINVFFFYLELWGRRESSLTSVYIELCYSYVLVFLFFYKIRILSSFCSIYGVGNAFHHKTMVATQG
jgi:hypothetical protein